MRSLGRVLNLKGEEVALARKERLAQLADVPAKCAPPFQTRGRRVCAPLYQMVSLNGSEVEGHRLVPSCIKCAHPLQCVACVLTHVSVLRVLRAWKADEARGDKVSSDPCQRVRTYCRPAKCDHHLDLGQLGQDEPALG